MFLLGRFHYIYSDTCKSTAFHVSVLFQNAFPDKPNLHLILEKEYLAVTSRPNQTPAVQEAACGGPVERPGKIRVMGNHHPYETEQNQLLDSAPGAGKPWMCGQTGE